MLFLYNKKAKKKEKRKITKIKRAEKSFHKRLGSISSASKTKTWHIAPSNMVMFSNNQLTTKKRFKYTIVTTA